MAAGAQNPSGETSMLQEEVLGSAQRPGAPWNSPNFWATPPPPVQVPGVVKRRQSELSKQDAPIFRPVVQVPLPVSRPMAAVRRRLWPYVEGSIGPIRDWTSGGTGGEQVASLV